MNCADCKISTYCEVITLCPLHAAAQDLLRALRETLDAMYDERTRFAVHQARWASAYAAIEKAEGK